MRFIPPYPALPQANIMGRPGTQACIQAIILWDGSLPQGADLKQRRISRTGASASDISLDSPAPIVLVA